MLRTLAAEAGGNTQLGVVDPATALVPVADVRRRQVRDLQVNDAAGDVVAAASLDDYVLSHGNAAHRDAVPQMRVGHQIQPDHARIGSRLRRLAPERFVGLCKQRIREVRVHLGAHVTDHGQHVVCGRYFLYLL